jgi:putative hydrolase of the HAD superfamily|tara:strand:- start:388 stop:1041 length:654 start_codon:yes stop_codon:yes gene_type:complete
MIFKDIECLLIDMDGVILDNAYDNDFWQNQIPEVIADSKGIAFDDAKRLAIQIFNYKKNTKDWYDVDYWSNMLNIDIEAQKRSEKSFSRISLYDGVIDTLSVLKNKTKMILITNAHRKTLNIKLEKYNLTPYFDEMVCAHELNYVKEDIQLWYMLRSKYRLDYEKTLLVEDTINNINVGLSAGISGAIYVGDEKFTVSDKIIKLSSINQILSAVNYR